MIASDSTAPPRAQRTNPYAIASLICGIIQFVGVLPAGIIAIVLGHVARREIRRTGEDGYGMAKAGLILGYVGVVLSIILVIVFLVLAVKVSTSMSGVGSPVPASGP